MNAEQLFKLNAAVCAVSLLCSGNVLAQTTQTWTGASNDFTLDSNWSTGVSPVRPDTAGVSLVNGAGETPLISLATAGQIPAGSVLQNGMTYVRFRSEVLVGKGATGALKINNSPNVDTGMSGLMIATDPQHNNVRRSVAVPTPLMRVGTVGGVGTLDVDLTNEACLSRGKSWGGSIGIGMTGTGNMNVLSYGKPASDIGQGICNSYPVSLADAVDYQDTNVFRGIMEKGSIQGLGFRSFEVGKGSNGKGDVQVDGAALTLLAKGKGDPANRADMGKYGALNVGDGAGSTGNIDVLNGGKLSVNLPPSLSLSTGKLGIPSTNISHVGKNGGTGTVTIAEEGKLPNRAAFNNGLDVGTGSGSNGLVDVLQGGKAWVNNDMVPINPKSCNKTAFMSGTAPLVLGTGTNNNGIFRVTGAGAVADITGTFSTASTRDDSSGNYALDVNAQDIGRIDINSGGKLVAADSGVINVGAMRTGYDESTSSPVFNTIGGLGPINIAANGGAYYGSEVAGAPLPYGTINTSYFNLTAASAAIVFNHTTDLTFSTPLKGTGQLIQQSGTTTISPTVTPYPTPDGTWNNGSPDPNTPAAQRCGIDSSGVPTDQTQFKGPVIVTGGTLILPVNDVLPGATSFTVKPGGTLVQPDTKQNLKAVTLDPGSTLTMQDGASTIDTATATSWKGGGTAALDTVLGSSPSPSDKIVITGPISGVTTLNIQNVGGAGALTSTDGPGILVVDGSRASGSGGFQLPGGPDASIAAGDYTYYLKKVGTNWYLVSRLTADPIDPTNPTDPANPNVNPPVPKGPTAGAGAGGAVAVPTMSTFGLVGMSGLLALAAGFFSRRRRPATTKRQD